MEYFKFFFFFSSRRRHTRCSRDWSSDVCSSDLAPRSCHSLHRSTRAAHRTARGGTGVAGEEIGRGAGRGRGEISVGAGSFKKKKKKKKLAQDQTLQKKLTESKGVTNDTEDCHVT